MSSFFIETAGIKAIAERKKVRHIRIVVKPPDGRVYVSIPQRAGLDTVKEFIRQKERWITEKQRQMRDAARNITSVGSETDEILLWGERVRLIVVTGQQREEVRLTGEGLTVMTPDSPSQEHLTGLLDGFYRIQMLERLPEVTRKWEQRTGVSAEEWKVRRMKTRWGSCNTDRRRIWLNNRLAMLPPECLDSVTVHELCHLYESGHGERFKALMDEYYPGWCTVKKYMKSMGAILS